MKLLTGKDYPHLCEKCQRAINQAASLYRAGVMPDTDDPEAPIMFAHDEGWLHQDCGAPEWPDWKIWLDLYIGDTWNDRTHIDTRRVDEDDIEGVLRGCFPAYDMPYIVVDGDDATVYMTLDICIECDRAVSMCRCEDPAWQEEDGEVLGFVRIGYHAVRQKEK